MITTSDAYVLEEGLKVEYNGLDIISLPTVIDEEDTVRVEVLPTTDDGQVMGSLLLSFTNAEIAAFTATGTTDRDKFFNQVEQAVKDYLENISDNSGATFTIA